jgi:phosphoglycerate dehydrogenase-like enzyme
MAMAKPLVGITDYIQPPAQFEAEGFPEAEFVFLRDWRRDASAAEDWRRCEALLTWHFPLKGPALELLERCRIVVRYGVAYETVDVPALAARGIPFCNTPDYGTEEVADTACAMVLSLQRKILGYDRAARTYGDTWQEGLLKPIRRANRCAVGIVGVGRIGTAVVNRLRPFGFRLLGYDPYKPSGHEKAVGYERTETLDELLREADIVTLHCPLTAETRGMVDARAMGLMKPGSSLVNCARGGVLSGLSDVEEALRSGRLGAAAFDVLPSEPPAEHPLLDAWRRDEAWLRGRLIINPHAAWYSEQGWYDMRYKAARTARMYLLEGRLRNCIPPEGERWS